MLAAAGGTKVRMIDRASVTEVIWVILSLNQSNMNISVEVTEQQTYIRTACITLMP